MLNSMEAGKVTSPLKVTPWGFIVTFGFVSMLMDVVYEAALSVQGPLLLGLGASAFVVGLVSGLGEATALAGRLFSGPLADRTGRYWTFAILGYAATALAVPAMGFIGSLVGVAALVVFERFGKSLRTPSRDAMLSHASAVVGRGKGFALHELMDQVGAMGGPLIAAAILTALGNDYRIALGVMIIPGATAVALLLALRRKVPNPAMFEEGLAANGSAAQAGAEHDGKRPEKTGLAALARTLPRRFWLYSCGCALALAGVTTSGVLSYHMVLAGVLEENMVPVLYAAAMGIDAVFALVTGSLYDKLGAKVLRALPFVCAAIPFFAYGDTVAGVLAGVVLWGASLGIQESTMRAAIGDMVVSANRASAYGIFSVFTGVGGLAGGIVAGVLYGVGVSWIAVYACVAEACALVVLWRCIC